MDCLRAETYVLDLLHQLPPDLRYHGRHHTLDVVAAAQALAAAEGITDPEQLTLLRTAAHYHDAGFLSTYRGHEAAGCALARTVLPGFGYSAAQIELICRLIMATEMPQAPGPEPLARILCDADLDYLGRPDYWPISQTLRTELASHGQPYDAAAWLRLQQEFLTTHRYWTRTAATQREPQKQARLAEVRAELAQLTAP
ncbi:HD domain-containing protein [Hymenobacter jeollabukensis]|uniref:HD domain-containing protein n=1 Tax=Hymenobacter jeollabukensis TaxID=2025313 RepID=A0A5R8WWS8_9BACT|nr:HD domain-containing protein [Hymenobacter jeollabukensis]TLM96968.1 HD domain-containing protein [Hymenobacter jeollabukensis]